ncbi:CTP:molybdopterin cytidylyltransferase MocA [Deinobacterium chartae]|uniref:CTP:molybdopterin cytidylyltransferase MocA n=1 Tax=Deinobacterium chartae TaxID=521158 RepID=A0A841I4Q4_9DEIO|nr:NTP transferase domain-containing protein [Deinobacterium chartae]MBB6099388.1 CTP:molybdopterin cytidylyltransferase MocA [Deinobacterium chartae]
MSENNVWSAVVLGGGDPGDPFAAKHGVAVKALIELEGRPMARYVLEALRASGRVRRIVYVGPVNAALSDLIDVNLPDAGSLLANLEQGVAALPQDARALVVTADVPMLTPEQVRSVLDEAPRAGLVYPIVRRADCERTYPGVKRTYARLREGSFTGGNLFLLEPKLVGLFLPQLRRVLELRKHPVALAGLIGPGVLLRLLLGRLSLDQLEKRVSDILGVPARALITAHAAVGTDVDKDADLALARAVLQSRPSL